MKKTLSLLAVAAIAGTAFAAANDALISFSTVGEGYDTYADGTKVLDGECYALVWTPSGSTFAGINADGTAAGDSKVVIAAPVAKDGKCPVVTFQVDEAYADKNYSGGTWGVYLLDTRKFAADADGVIIKGEDGKPVVESVGGSTVNGYGAVSTLSDSKMVAASASGSVNAATVSTTPAGASNLKINDIKFIGDKVYLYVTGSLSCLQYALQTGDKPNELAAPADGKAQYGKDVGEMIIVTPKKPGAQFFKVNRK